MRKIALTNVFTAFALLLLAMPSAHGLKNDKDQPAVIVADEVEFNFKTGVRTYKGNVKVNQGTMIIIADKLVVEYKDEQLQRAVAFGNLAEFRQIPDGKTEEVIGRGKRLELDEIGNVVTLLKNAVVIQQGQTIQGESIVYNMATDQMKVKGPAQKQVKIETTGTEKSSGTDNAQETGDGESGTQAVSENAGGSAIEEASSGRSKITIPAKKKPVEETEQGDDDENENAEQETSESSD